MDDRTKCPVLLLFLGLLLCGCPSGCSSSDAYTVRNNTGTKISTVLYPTPVRGPIGLQFSEFYYCVLLEAGHEASLSNASEHRQPWTFVQGAGILVVHSRTSSSAFELVNNRDITVSVNANQQLTAFGNNGVELLAAKNADWAVTCTVK
jgi:hypothetical protein